jgi:hypothetical protein
MVVGFTTTYAITPVSFINKTDRHDITEVLLKVTLNYLQMKHTHVIIKDK